MKIAYKNLLGQETELTLMKHDISKYDVLFHVTLKSRRKSIEKQGLLIGQELNKSLVDSNMLFFSYPIDMNTSDCFRWSDEYYSLIVLDAKLLNDDNVEFYDDPFSQKDNSSKKNHLCCLDNIPEKYIKKIIEF
jgi:hypothetical protein